MLATMKTADHTRTRVAITAFLLLIAAATSGGVPEGASKPSDKDGSLAVLFLGNSLTYANDLPAIVEAMFAAAGVAATVESVAHPDWGLEDHWRSRRSRRAIDHGGWDVVVMQQGPSATEGRPSLLEYSQRLGERIRAAGARPALYMVWPARARAFDFDGVARSYALAAEAADGLLLPAGDAWRAAWRRDPDLALYGGDGFHPSMAGSYLAAAVIFQGLTGRDPRELPARLELPPKGRPLILEPELAHRLQEAAAEATAERSDQSPGPRLTAA